MIYRVHVYSAEMNSEGYEYFSSKKDALDYRASLVKDGYDRDDVTIHSAPTPTTKKQIIALLRRWANHPDNG